MTPLNLMYDLGKLMVIVTKCCQAFGEGIVLFLIQD